MGEQFYYNSGNFAYRCDDDGRLIDNMNGQIIGICTQKKNEILADFNAVNDENDELKSRLGEIEKALEEHRHAIPAELLRFVEKPPSVESLQEELRGLKAMLSVLIDERRGAVDDNRGSLPKTGAKQTNTKRRGSQAEVDGDKLEQP